MKKLINTKPLQEILGVSFSNEDLLIRALVHRSSLNDDEVERSNERLEYLGDAVIELSISQLLFEKYPEFEEGKLTSLRSALVKTDSLAKEALKLQLGNFIYMSTGEETTGGRERPYILANTMEAVIGAMYLDQGFKVTHSFIEKYIFYKIEEIVKNRLDVDAKSLLQEITQEKVRVTPVYEIVSEKGPDHKKLFTMAVKINDFILATGEGNSKQTAERAAARKAVTSWEDLEKLYLESLK